MAHFGCAQASSVDAPEFELGLVVVHTECSDERVEGEEAVEEQQDPEQADRGEVQGQEGGVLLDVPGECSEEGEQLGGARLRLCKLAKEQALAAL